MANNIVISKAFLKGLKEARDNAVRATQNEFVYDGHTFVVSYAKYFLDFHTQNMGLKPSFKDGQEVTVERYGDGKVVGYVGQQGSMNVRVQFKATVNDFDPIILWTITKGAKLK